MSSESKRLTGSKRRRISSRNNQLRKKPRRDIQLPRNVPIGKIRRVTQVGPPIYCGTTQSPEVLRSLYPPLQPPLQFITQSSNGVNQSDSKMSNSIPFSQSESKSQSQNQNERKIDSKSQNQNERKIDSKSQNQNERKIDSKSQNQNERKIDSKSQTQIQNESEKKIESKSQSQIQNQNERKIETKSQTQIERKIERKNNVYVSILNKINEIKSRVLNRTFSTIIENVKNRIRLDIELKDQMVLFRDNFLKSESAIHSEESKRRKDRKEYQIKNIASFINEINKEVISRNKEDVKMREERKNLLVKDIDVVSGLMLCTLPPVEISHIKKKLEEFKKQSLLLESIRQKEEIILSEKRSSVLKDMLKKYKKELLLKESEMYVSSLHNRISNETIISDNLSIEKDKSSDVCHICLNSKINSVFDQCGHMVSCYRCSLRVIESTSSCPICFKSVTKALSIKS